MPRCLGAVGQAGDFRGVGQEIIKLDPHQVMLQSKSFGDGAGHGDIGAFIGAHRDQMGFDALLEHRTQDHPGIEAS